MDERELIKDQLICHQSVPIVLSGLISEWPAASWTPTDLTKVLGDRSLQFRIGKLTSSEVQWENKCDYTSASVEEFNEWVRGECSAENALLCYDRATHWCYADYKYMAELFEDQPHFLKAVDWSVIGLKDRGGQQSTFWLGSQGSNTVCHYDSYGCNVVAQIHGRKRWILFAPSDTKYMYPTRIPYEESSVFSRVFVKSPDLNHFPEFKHVTPYVVTLEPGDVLFVPPRWWHFVESLEPSISINSWIEMVRDDGERLREAVTRTMAFMLMSDSDAPIGSWLNPTEDFTDKVQNTEFIRLTLSTVLEKGLADEFLKGARPVNSHSKRPREHSLSDDVENLQKFPRTRDEFCDAAVIIDSRKTLDISTLCRNLGGQAREVGACSWNEYCRMFQIDINTFTAKDELTRPVYHRNNRSGGGQCVNQSSMHIQVTDHCAKNDATERDLRESLVASKTGSTDLGISSTSCPSTSDRFLREITSVDLADVFLDPEVIDLMCQKLIRKCQRTT